MANIKIIDLSTGSPESNSYIEATQVDSQAASGRSSVKVNMAELGNWIAGQGNSPLEYNDLKTEDDTPIGAINELHDSIGADVYTTSTSYTAGMYCIYNNTLYRCKENTSGAWDSSKWEAKTITSLLESKQDSITFYTRTNISQPVGTSYWSFSVPQKTGYSRFVVGANPSTAEIEYIRFLEDGNNLRIYMNNLSNSSVTYDLTIAVVYKAN